MSNARELAKAAASYGSGGFVGMKNRLINGSMVVDQRYAGAVATSGTGGALVYAVDRFFIQNDTATTYTAQQSTDVPNGGFKNSIKISNTTAASPTTNQQRLFGQNIEGNNIYDIGFGTSGAKAVTLSFWVKSTTAGTYSVAIENPNGSYSYVGQYIINSANTWEYKTITATAQTAGTWATNTSAGLGIYFDLGCGTGLEGTASAWNTADKKRASGNVALFSSANQSIYFAGIQLEAGPQATPFEFRHYGTELALCYRYYRRYGPGNNQMIGAGYATSSGAIWRWGFTLDIPMRVPPTVLFNTCVAWAGSTLGGTTIVSTSYTGTNFVDCDIGTSGMGVAVVGGIAKVYTAGASPYIELSGAEL